MLWQLISGAMAFLSSHLSQRKGTSWTWFLMLLLFLDTLGLSKEPGRAEADFGLFDVKTVIRNIYILFSGSEVPTARDDQEIMDLFDPSTPLPPWFSEEDLAAYASLYENSRFGFPLQVPYRCWATDSGVTDPKVTVPALLIMGEKDYFLKFPGIEDYIKSGLVKHFVPDLDVISLEEVNHFVQEKLPGKVNEHHQLYLQTQ